MIGAIMTVLQYLIAAAEIYGILAVAIILVRVGDAIDKR